MDIKDGLLYTKQHEWALIEGTQVKVGISDYAQHSLGDITFVELPEVDTDVIQFSSVATIESVKAASDVYTPFSGKVVKVNDQLEASPDLVNKSAYEEGWFFVLEAKDLNEKSNLMDASQYRQYLATLEE